jgi:hypothetical protein
VALNTIKQTKKQANKQTNKQTNKQNLFSIMTNLVLTGADKQHDKTSSRWLTYLWKKKQRQTIIRRIKMPK